jgi:hypothetical protein
MTVPWTALVLAPHLPVPEQGTAGRPLWGRLPDMDRSHEATSSSPSQEEMWLLAQLAGDVPIGNQPITIRRRGGFEAAPLEETLAALVLRHDAWRTTLRPWLTVTSRRPKRRALSRANTSRRSAASPRLNPRGTTTRDGLASRSSPIARRSPASSLALRASRCPARPVAGARSAQPATLPAPCLWSGSWQPGSLRRRDSVPSDRLGSSPRQDSGPSGSSPRRGSPAAPSRGPLRPVR